MTDTRPSTANEVFKKVEGHLIYMEAALKAEEAFRAMPIKLRDDLLLEIKTARKEIDAWHSRP